MIYRYSSTWGEQNNPVAKKYLSQGGYGGPSGLSVGAASWQPDHFAHPKYSSTFAYGK